MKLLFLTIGNENRPSTRYRVLQWIPFLEEKGWRVEWIFAKHIRLKKFLQIIRCSYRADIVYIQKKLFTRPFLFLLRRISNKIMFDFDDALYSKDTFSGSISSLGSGSNKTKRRLNYTLKSADTVITGNDNLKSYSSAYNPSVKVVPTVVDHSEYRVAEKLESHSISIGWLGLSYNNGYLDKLGDVLRAISKKFPNVTLKVISDKVFELEGVKCRNIKWNLENYKSDLSEMDIGIMPLLDDEWSR